MPDSSHARVWFRNWDYQMATQRANRGRGEGDYCGQRRLADPSPQGTRRANRMREHGMCLIGARKVLIGGL